MNRNALLFAVSLLTIAACKRGKQQEKVVPTAVIIAGLDSAKFDTAQGTLAVNAHVLTMQNDSGKILDINPNDEDGPDIMKANMKIDLDFTDEQGKPVTSGGRNVVVNYNGLAIPDDHNSDLPTNGIEITQTNPITGHITLYKIVPDQASFPGNMISVLEKLNHTGDVDHSKGARFALEAKY